MKIEEVSVHALHPSVPYNMVVAVGVWRSAGRYEGDPRLRNLARIVMVAGMLLLSLT